MRRAMMINLCFLSVTICVEAEQNSSRIVHFPKNRAVGRLMIREIDPNQRSRFMSGWELLNQAQGDVTIPAGKQLRLEVYRDETDISFISELQSNDLESLSLSRTNIVDEDFVHLKGLTDLLYLDLSSMKQIDGSGLAHLTHFKALKELTCFNSNIADSAMEHISKISSLEDLTLYMTQVDGSGLIHLKNLSSLKNLSLSKTSITDVSLAHLKDMTWLKELELYDTQIGDDGLAYLKGLTSLEKLILGSIDRSSEVSHISDVGLVYLSALTKLKDLRLYRTCITDTGLKHLSGLTNLESLSINGSNITGVEFLFLNKLAPLKSIGLNETALTGSGLSSLEPWSNTLENLVLQGVKLNDADLVYLADFNVLKYINLSDTPISDAGLVHLKNIKSLETFYCRNTKITDEGLMTLKDLPNLKNINVTGTLVTNTGLEGFKQASASKSLEANVSRIMRMSKQKGLESKKIVSEQPEPQPLPLVGKPIPDLDKLNIDINQEQASGRMMLFCFFDMEQRPSRNCVLQLSKKSNDLQAKDIVIITIQASKIDQEALNQWVKKYNIPFPVGIVKDDAEKTHFAWGVKSLPWLILTDGKHIVRACGFSLGELDKNINEVEER